MTATVEQFGRGLVAAGIMSADELKQWWSAQPADGKPRDGEHFSDLLRAQNKITGYQSKVLLQNKPTALVFDQYTFIEQIGKGGMGAVFKAKHRTTGRMAAIKVLSAQATKDEKAVKRFQREVEAAGKLQHPHIVRSFDAGEVNGQHYLAMEFVDGSDLSSIVKSKGRFPVEQAVNFALQAAEGLKYAHEKGVIHRDIKPANLLLDSKGTVRILDLGLVRFEDAQDALTGTQQIMGTIDYMAPEQVANTKLADARCDIYSLGVTLWILLTGKKLYESKNLVDIVMQHRTAEIPSLAKERNDAPAALEGVLKRMLAKKADDRYQTMAEVCQALTAILKGGSPAAEKPAAKAAEKTPAKPAAGATTQQVAQQPTEKPAAKAPAAQSAPAAAATADEEEAAAPPIAAPTRSRSAKRKAAQSAARKQVIFLVVGAIFVTVTMGFLVWYLTKS